MLSIYAAFESLDADGLDENFSHTSEMLAFGTDWDEKFSGWTEYKNIHKTQFKSLKSFRFQSRELEVHVNGETAWAADRPLWKIVTKSGEKHQLRGPADSRAQVGRLEEALARDPVARLIRAEEETARILSLSGETTLISNRRRHRREQMKIDHVSVAGSSLRALEGVVLRVRAEDRVRWPALERPDGDVSSRIR